MGTRCMLPYVHSAIRNTALLLCRIHIYAASLGDNSAIMRRARARLSLGALPSSSYILTLFLYFFFPPLHCTSSRLYSCNHIKYMYSKYLVVRST